MNISFPYFVALFEVNLNFFPVFPTGMNRNMMSRFQGPQLKRPPMMGGYGNNMMASPMTPDPPNGQFSPYGPPGGMNRSGPGFPPQYQQPPPGYNGSNFNANMGGKGGGNMGGMGGMNMGMNNNMGMSGNNMGMGSNMGLPPQYNNNMNNSMGNNMMQQQQQQQFFNQQQHMQQGGQPNQNNLQQTNNQTQRTPQQIQQQRLQQQRLQQQNMNNQQNVNPQQQQQQQLQNQQIGSPQQAMTNQERPSTLQYQPNPTTGGPRTPNPPPASPLNR